MRPLTRVALAAAIGFIAIAALMAALLVAGAYRRDMQHAYARIEGRSQVIPSPWGDIEYSDEGSGPAVLVVHGSGGGFDQGELLGRAVLGEGFRRITPSRFGYLRSTFHAGATFDDQAHAFAYLLDHLHVERAAVVAFSHGGPSALLFAVLHPQRVSSLTLLSAGVASVAGVAAVEGEAGAAAPSEAAHRKADAQGEALMNIFQHDPAYWALTKAMPNRFIALMGANAEVLAGLGPEQRRLVDQLIASMNPVSPRAAGTVFDHHAAMPNERIAAIRAPTLIVHARDDTLQPFTNAQFAACTIPDAQLVAFDRGGHLVLATQLAAVRAAVTRHAAHHLVRNVLEHMLQLVHHAALVSSGTP